MSFRVHAAKSSLLCKGKKYVCMAEGKKPPTKTQIKCHRKAKHKFKYYFPGFIHAKGSISKWGEKQTLTNSLELNNNEVV